jgi:pimeloyl-ACP methyl ester carboxylesterase
MAPTPFQIAIPDEELRNLQARLDAVRLPQFLDGVGWAYGIDKDYLGSLLETWRSDFDWRAQERSLNAYPQATVTIDGVGIHYAHVRGVGPNPMPLILTHGWPSTFIENLAIADRLADPAKYGGDPEDAFDVVVPSLPGYGFSDVSASPGMSVYVVAKLWPKLMQALGYRRYGAHGCDVGSHVTALMGLNAPEGLVGVHMGSVPIPPAGRKTSGERTDEEAAYLRRASDWKAAEYGYVEIQSTKPHTLAVGLSDSPAGLAAWIAEKWRAWSDCGDEDRPESAIPRDVLLTNIALYWFTNTIGSSIRYYYETARIPRRFAPGQRIDLPCGFFLEPPGRGIEGQRTGRMGAPPRFRTEEGYNIRRWFVPPRGGHFPALEVPDLLVDELRMFFRELR